MNHFEILIGLYSVAVAIQVSADAVPNPEGGIRARARAQARAEARAQQPEQVNGILPPPGHHPVQQIIIPSQLSPSASTDPSAGG